jgi:polysaccharide biosynthesis/export protein ExoF
MISRIRDWHANQTIPGFANARLALRRIKLVRMRLTQAAKELALAARMAGSRLRMSLAQAVRKLALAANSTGPLLKVRDLVQIGLTTAIVLATLQLASAQYRVGAEQARLLRPVEIDSIAATRGELLFALGDRLKISFFEKIETADTSSGNTAASSIVERAELTGEYSVQQDGNLFLPLLGPTAVAGKTTQQVEDAMRRAFERTFGRQAKISLIITEREPVYVMGPVGRPGAFKYSPGMTVLHAIALAGGFEGASADVMQYLEAMRETERVQKTVERLKVLLARQAVLMGEHLGQPVEVPPRLIELAGAAGAETLLADITRMRTQTAASRDAQITGLDAVISATRKELKSLQARAVLTQANIDARQERLNDLSDLRDRGSGNGFVLLQARTDVGDVQERLQEVWVAVSRAELKLVQAEQEKVKILTDAGIERDRDLFQTESEIAHELVALGMSRHLVSTITKKSYNLPGAKPDVNFRIVRRSSSGPIDLAGEETTPLMPGDLINISNKTKRVNH